MIRKVVAMVMMSLMMGAVSFGAYRASADFTGPALEGDVFPGAATPVWDWVMPSPESTWASTDGDILTVNSWLSPMGTPVWVLPGEYGGNYSSGTQNYPDNPDPAAVNNPWQPDPKGTGYTVEIGMQLLQTQVAYGVLSMCFDIGEGGGNMSFDLQFVTDKIMDSFGHVIYTGDLSDKQHAIRFLRWDEESAPGVWDIHKFDLYIDSVLVYSYPTDGVFALAACNQERDYFYLGTQTGSAEWLAEIDYLRMDFTGAYTPEPATMILLGLGSLLLRRKN